jgi:hypothetical protein
MPAHTGAHTPWDVYLNGQWIDRVFFTADCDADYVRRSLINHDGYNPNITVHKGR